MLVRLAGWWLRFDMFGSMGRAVDAQMTSDKTLGRCCFGIIRSLAGGKPGAHQTITMNNREKVRSDEERSAQWQEHWAEVFQGDAVEYTQHSPQGAPLNVVCSEIDVGPVAMGSTFLQVQEQQGHRQRPCAERGAESRRRADGSACEQPRQ